MWVLKTEGSATSILQYTLFAGEHEIGRSGPKPENAGCDGWITFPGVDKSISRNHAKIKVKPLGDPQAMEQRQSICIRDRSKFGVSIDDVDECYRDKGGRATQSSQKSVHQIQKDKDVPLKQGCTITIGVNNSRLRLEWEEFVVCHSLLPKDQVSSLANTCAQLGVHLSKSWSDRVRVLVMDQIQMTPKVLLALIDQKDIVTSAYLVAIRKRANIGDPLPDPSANGVVWEFVNNNIWRHRITGDTQDQEPPPDQMIMTQLYRPAFVEGFPEDYKEFVNARGKGLGGPGVKTNSRSSLFEKRTLIFLQVESGSVTLRQYKQVCERARAKVQVWEAAQVVKQWSTYVQKLPSSGDSIWHVLVPDDQSSVDAVAEAVQLLRSAGAIYSTLDSLWRAVVTAEISCVERDEWDMTQSLDASGQPDVLSLPSGGTRISLSAETSAQGKSQRSETAESVKKKRPRDDGVDSSESAASRKPMSSKTQVGGQFDEGVIEIDDASEGPPATTTDSRSSKRTRTGVEAISTALPQASASTPTGKGREKATTRHQGILSGAHGQELLPAVGMSPATARRQNAVEKETAEKTRGAETGQSTNHAATQSPLCRPAAAGAPAQRKEAECSPKSSGCNAVDSVTQGEGSSVLSDVGGSWGQRAGGGESTASGARTSSHRFELEDKMDPDGWVVIISEGPAPRLSASAAPQDGLAGVRAACSGGAVAGQINAVNWKRFHKKADCTGPACRSRPNGAVRAEPTVAFDLWPRRAAGGEDKSAGSQGRTGALTGQRRRPGGHAAGNDRCRGSDNE